MMDVILISYLILSTIISFALFLLIVTDERKLYMYHYCPKYIRENTKCNALGVFLIWLLMFAMIPVYYLLWFGYWLCHVGRK